MRWGLRRRPRVARAPRFARERDALEHLIATTDNVAVAELARLRLRAARFADAHLTPTPSAPAEPEATPATVEADLLQSLATTTRTTKGLDLPALPAHFAAMDRIIELNQARRAEEAARQPPVVAPPPPPVPVPTALPVPVPRPAPKPKPRPVLQPREPSEWLANLAFATAMTVAAIAFAIPLVFLIKGLSTRDPATQTAAAVAV